MQTIIIKSKDESLALGGSTKRAFGKQGFVTCVFKINEAHISYSIESIDSYKKFRFKPRTKLESFSNLIFLAKFKNVIRVSEELRNVLQSKGKLQLS